MAVNDVEVVSRDYPTPVAPVSTGTLTMRALGDEWGAGRGPDTLEVLRDSFAEGRARMDAGGPSTFLTSREETPDEWMKRVGTIGASKSPVPTTLATMLGADVDPMETAKTAMRAIANGEVDDPLLSPTMARVVGAGLAFYQGIETFAGATGIGNPNRVLPPEVPKELATGPRGAAAGYVAEKTGRSADDVLFSNSAKYRDPLDRPTEQDMQAREMLLNERDVGVARDLARDEVVNFGLPNGAIEVDASRVPKNRKPVTEAELSFLQAALTSRLASEGLDAAEKYSVADPLVKRLDDADFVDAVLRGNTSNARERRALEDLGQLGRKVQNAKARRGFIKSPGKPQRNPDPVNLQSDPDARVRDYALVGSVASQILRMPEVKLSDDVARLVVSSPSMSGMAKAVLGRSDVKPELVDYTLMHGTDYAAAHVAEKFELTPQQVKDALTTARLHVGSRRWDRVMRGLLGNKNRIEIPAEDFAGAAGSSDGFLRSAAAAHPALDESTRRVLGADPDSYVRFNVARRADTTAEELKSFAADSDPYVRGAAYRSPNMDGESLKAAALAVIADAVRPPPEPGEAANSGPGNGLTGLPRGVRAGILTAAMYRRDTAEPVFTALASATADDIGHFDFGNRGSVGMSIGQNKMAGALRAFLSRADVPVESKARVIVGFSNNGLWSGINESTPRGGLDVNTVLTRYIGEQAGLLLTDGGPSVKRDPRTVDARKRLFGALYDEVRRTRGDIRGTVGPETRYSTMSNPVDVLGVLLGDAGVANAAGRAPTGAFVEPQQGAAGKATNDASPDVDALKTAFGRLVRGGELDEPGKVAINYAVKNLKDAFRHDERLTEAGARNALAALATINRMIRERGGGEIRPGDASTKLAWFRDDDVRGIVRPTLQTEDFDTPPVVMWLHPTIGKTSLAEHDANLIDFDAVRHAHLKDLIKSWGYQDYGEPGPNGERFSKTAWRLSHPGVIESADSELLDMVLRDPRSRGHIVVTSVASHLAERPQDMSLVVDVPREVFMPRVMKRDHLDERQAANWKDRLDAIMDNVKSNYGERYMQTSDFMEDMIAAPEFEEAISRAGLPLAVRDTGTLGLGGLFLSGTAGDLAYTMGRPSFNARWDVGNHSKAARTFVSVSDLERGVPESNGVPITYHDSDAGTGALKWHLPDSVTDRMIPGWQRFGRGKGRSSGYELANLSLIRPEDVQTIINGVKVAAGPDADGPGVSRPRAEDMVVRSAWSRKNPTRLSPPRLPIPGYMSSFGSYVYALTVPNRAYEGSFVKPLPGGASWETRFKGLVAARRVQNLLDDAEGRFRYPEKPVYDGGSHRNLPNTEFKTRGAGPEDWNRAARVIVVPESFIGTPQEKFLSRRYPDIVLRTFRDTEGFSRESGKAAMETRESAKGGDAQEGAID